MNLSFNSRLPQQQLQRAQQQTRQTPANQASKVGFSGNTNPFSSVNFSGGGIQSLKSLPPLSTLPALQNVKSGGIISGFFDRIQSHVQGMKPVIQDKIATAQLQERPFAPENVNMFATGVYPDSPELGFAQGPAKTPEQTQQDLQAFLTQRFADDPAKVQEALNHFNDPALIEKVPDARLRSAAVSLMGTIGEPTIQSIKDDPNLLGIDFGTPPSISPDGKQPTAQVTFTEDGQRLVIFNRNYEHENPQLLSSILYHEMLHTDKNVALEEEMAASSLQYIAHMQQLQTDPSIAQGQTGLTQSMNTFTLARLNSGDPNSASLSIFSSDPNRNIFPGGSRQVKDFASLASGPSAPTEGNALLQSSLAQIANPGVTPPTDPDFDQNTLQFINDNLNPEVLSNKELVDVANTLQLDVPTPGQAIASKVKDALGKLFRR